MSGKSLTDLHSDVFKKVDESINSAEEYLVKAAKKRLDIFNKDIMSKSSKIIKIMAIITPMIILLIIGVILLIVGTTVGIKELSISGTVLIIIGLITTVPFKSGWEEYVLEKEIKKQNKIKEYNQLYYNVNKYIPNKI
jgi:hypothetical protein